MNENTAIKDTNAIGRLQALRGQPRQDTRNIPKIDRMIEQARQLRHQRDDPYVATQMEKTIEQLGAASVPP